ncbi:hypothetical protein A0H81_08922 [Grifola frondosa]|uniref:Uncharacterized protein n=1 Tax=Grifola frondosa TaxID=5627 RepID=A0A1C7M458_GRIFR|nr:hypothetical protein A0H81_08922 [Grifola frondosa]
MSWHPHHTALQRGSVTFGDTLVTEPVVRGVQFSLATPFHTSVYSRFHHRTFETIVLWPTKFNRIRSRLNSSPMNNMDTLLISRPCLGTMTIALVQYQNERKLIQLPVEAEYGRLTRAYEFILAPKDSFIERPMTNWQDPSVIADNYVALGKIGWVLFTAVACVLPTFDISPATDANGNIVMPSGYLTDASCFRSMHTDLEISRMYFASSLIICSYVPKFFFYFQLSECRRSL